MRFGLLLQVVFVLSVQSCAAENAKFDWPQFRGPNRNGISNESDVLIAWPADAGPDVLRFWRGWIEDTPDELCTMAAFLYAPPEPFVPPEVVGSPIFAIACVHLDPHGTAEADLRPLRELGEALQARAGVLQGDEHVAGGEAAAAPTMTGETVPGMMAAVGYLAPPLIGRPADDFAGATAAMDAAMYGNTGAKAAIDIALHDLVAWTAGKPLHALFGPKLRSRISVLAVLGSTDETADLRQALAAWPAYTPAERAVMVLDGNCRVLRDPDRDAGPGRPARAAERQQHAAQREHEQNRARPVETRDQDGRAPLARQAHPERQRHQGDRRARPEHARPVETGQQGTAEHRPERPGDAEGGGVGGHGARAQRRRIKLRDQRRAAAHDQAGADALQHPRRQQPREAGRGGAEDEGDAAPGRAEEEDPAVAGGVGVVVPGGDGDLGRVGVGPEERPGRQQAGAEECGCLVARERAVVEHQGRSEIVREGAAPPGKAPASITIRR